MRKTISSGIDRRAVYKFKCSGPCQRVKYTYVYERAKKGCCLTCSKNEVDKNQESLFEPNVAQINLMDNSIELIDSSGKKRTVKGYRTLTDEELDRINSNPYYSDQTKKDLINELSKKEI